MRVLGADTGADAAIFGAMDDEAFDRALVSSAFTLAADEGWPRVTVTAAAGAAGLPLDRARARFLGRTSILGRFGQIADQSALANATREGTSRDRLFDLVMRRVDVLQTHRGGVLALRTYLPMHPALTAALWGATLSSMAWLLEAAGVSTLGWRGALRVHGLAAIWARTLRAWERDESEDLSATMAALDRGLDQAIRAEGWIGGRPEASETTSAAPPPPAPVFDAQFPAGPPIAPHAEPPMPPPPMAPEPPASPPM